MDYQTAKKKDILKDLCDRLKTLGGQFYAMGKERPELSAELDMYFRELSDIESTLNAYFLYPLKSHGTQKTYYKAKASKANGKKGGRPPKAIAELRKRLAELTGFCTDFEIRHSVAEWETNAEYKAKDTERQQVEKELGRLTQEWEAKKAQDKESGCTPL